MMNNSDTGFYGAYSRLLRARAALDDPEERTDEAWDAVIMEAVEAERDFFIMRATKPNQIVKKVEILDSVLSAEQTEGRRNYPVVAIALAAIKADLLSLDIESDTGGCTERLMDAWAAFCDARPSNVVELRPGIRR